MLTLLLVAQRSSIKLVASIMVLVWCVFTALNWNFLVSCNIAVSSLFSPSTILNSTVSPCPTMQRLFLGLFFFIAVCCKKHLSWYQSYWWNSMRYLHWTICCSYNLHCDDLLAPTYNSSQPWVDVHSSNTNWTQQILFIYLFTYMYNSNN